jgi:hypothetical protein
MRLYCEREGYVPEAKIALFHGMTAFVEALPDVDPPERVSCHVLTRMLAARFAGVRVVDGNFQGRGSHHSWLDLGDGVVADVYPIGGVVPFLVETSGYMNPWNRMYLPDPGVAEGLEEDPQAIADEILATMGSGGPLES